MCVCFYYLIMSSTCSSSHAMSMHFLSGLGFTFDCGRSLMYVNHLLEPHSSFLLSIWLCLFSVQKKRHGRVVLEMIIGSWIISLIYCHYPLVWNALCRDWVAAPVEDTLCPFRFQVPSWKVGVVSTDSLGLCVDSHELLPDEGRIAQICHFNIFFP